MLKPKRKFSGLWGVLSFTVMGVVMVSCASALQLPGSVLWAAVAFSVLMIGLAVLRAVRGAAERTQDYSTFESNKIGDPITEHFKPPYHRDLRFEPDEKVLGKFAPVIQTLVGIGDFFRGGVIDFLGKSTVTDAENAIVLTNRRMFMLMIGPDEIRRHCRDPKATAWLEALPGDASDKRRMLWRTGAAEVGEALDGLLATRSLEQLQQSLFTFTIPVADIASMAYTANNRVITFQLDGMRLRYTMKTSADFEALVNGLTSLGVNNA